MSLIKDLYLKIDNFKLSIDSLELSDQKCTCIMGPSGSGKSTLLKTLIGFEKSSNAKWLFQDLDLLKLNISDRKIGYMSQSYDLFGHLSVYENIKIIANARHTNQSDWKKEFDYYLTKLKMNHLLQQTAGTLSGGEKQRLSLIRALISKPRIILMDEPFSALDSNLKNEARCLVRDLLSEKEIPSVLVTHDFEDAKVLSEKVVSLKNGKVDKIEFIK